MLSAPNASRNCVSYWAAALKHVPSNAPQAFAESFHLLFSAIFVALQHRLALEACSPSWQCLVVCLVAFGGASHEAVRRY